MTGRTRAGQAAARAVLSLRARPGIGDRRGRLLIDRFGGASEALSAQGWGRDPGLRQQVDTWLEGTRAGGFTLWTYGSAEYPQRLTNLDDPPLALWGQGRSELLRSPAVAVVGARRATRYGLRMARELGACLASRGLVVVSGMALGIDAAAHRGALEVGGDSIAVLGSGLDRPTPRSNRDIHEALVQRGLVVSEFPPGTEARPGHFPRRNRVIAALTQALVVVEAGRRSGALITVDHALDLGHTVLAVPGPVGRPQSQGTLSMLEDGAEVVTSAEGCAARLARELLPVGTSGPGPRPAPGPPASFATEPDPSRSQESPAFGARGTPAPRGDAHALWRALAAAPTDEDGLEALAAGRGWPASRFHVALAALELGGWVERGSSGQGLVALATPNP